MDWTILLYCALFLWFGALCFFEGYHLAKIKYQDEFKPTQETWLELEKFRWTHKCNALTDEEDSNG